MPFYASPYSMCVVQTLGKVCETRFIVRACFGLLSSAPAVRRDARELSYPYDGLPHPVAPEADGPPVSDA